MLLAAAGAWQEVARTVHETPNLPVGPRSVRAVRVKLKEQRLVRDAGWRCARRSESARRLRRKTSPELASSSSRVPLATSTRFTRKERWVGLG